MDYERRLVMDVSYSDAVTRVRQALAEQGFGVLTEIDVGATLREKLGLEMEDYLILGACNPDLAHQALQVEPGVGVLLPCNVVVSAADGAATVRILNPADYGVADRPGRAPADRRGGEPPAAGRHGQTVGCQVK